MIMKVTCPLTKKIQKWKKGQNHPSYHQKANKVISLLVNFLPVFLQRQHQNVSYCKTALQNDEYFSLKTFKIKSAYPVFKNQIMLSTFIGLSLFSKILKYSKNQT